MSRRRRARLGASLLAGGLLLPAAARAQASASPAPLPEGFSGLYLEAHFASGHDDPDRAAADFLRLTTADSGDPELRRLAFQTNLLAGNPEATRLAAGLPDNGIARLLLADTRAAAGDWAGARALYDAMPQDGLGGAVQPILLAWSYVAAGQTDAALALLRAASQPQAHGIDDLHAALIADLAGRNDLAAKLYAQTEQRLGGVNLRLAEMIASFDARQGRPMQAEQALDRVVRGSPNLAIAAPDLLADIATRPVETPLDGIAEAYLQLAVVLQQQGAAEPAIMLLRLTLDLRPKLGAALLLLSELQQQLHHPELALHALDGDAPDDPLRAVVAMHRVGLLTALGRNADAERRLQDLAASHPASPVPLVALGDLDRMDSRNEQALARYDQAIALVPQPGPADWGLFYDRAIALDALHRWPAAEADLRHALALSPDQPSVLNYLGYSYAVQNRELPQAQALIERALAHEPDDGAIMDSLGWVLLRRGDVPGALRWLERAVALTPEDPTVTGHLGDAYQAAGRPAEAQAQWRRALGLNPPTADRAHLEAELHEPSTATPPAAAQR